MKKQGAILLTMIIMMISAGCTPVPTTPQQPKETPAVQQEQQPASQAPPSQTAPQHIGTVVSLGDTYSDWEAMLGHAYAQGDSLKVYKNGAYQVVFSGNKAITITFTTKNGKNTFTTDLLPKDGKKQSSSSKDIQGVTMIVEKWHSDALAASIPETKGSYTIMKNKKGTTYDSVVVDCSPNLKK